MVSLLCLLLLFLEYTTGLCSRPPSFINDLTEINLMRWSQNNFVCMMSCCSSHQLPWRLQNDIDEVGNWSSIKFLTLNRDKCKTWLFHAENCIYSIFTTFAWRPFSGTGGMFTYLGVLLSHDLSWGEHVRAICSKARKILSLLYRRFYNNAPSSTVVCTLLQLYISLVIGPIWIMPQPSGPLT